MPEISETANSINITNIVKPVKSAKRIQFEGLVYDPNKPRNVVDPLKWLTAEQIRADLNTKRQNFSILLVNVDYDLNTGTIIRTANVFGASEVILYGRKKFDRRASVGAEFYTNFRQIEYLDQLETTLSEYGNIIALENNLSNTESLINYKWDYSQKILICLGQEGNGIPSEILNLCKTTLEIPQLGSVRSLNVSTAAAIVMYDYLAKQNF